MSDTREIVCERLTAEGRQYALATQNGSLVARIALAADCGGAQDWPDEYVATAIRVVNYRARTDVPGHPSRVLCETTARLMAEGAEPVTEVRADA
jgi:hypothetical protein